jgi:hypothetical protein
MDYIRLEVLVNRRTRKNQLDFKVTVHRTDTISIVIGCSCHPVAVDMAGVIRLSNAHIHDKLERSVNEKRYGNCNDNSSPLIVPNHMTWTVTMWHFGADSNRIQRARCFKLAGKLRRTH